MTSVAIALGMTLLAGLSTGIGSAIAFFFRRPKMAYLSFALGLSGGVMVYVSFMDLIPVSARSLGAAWTSLAFFVGLAFIALVDQAIPESANPHAPATEGELETITTRPHVHETAAGGHAARPHSVPGGTDKEAVDELRSESPRRSMLLRAGMLTALAIGIHNFPEGLATFSSALSDVHIGAAIAVAIAIHNVPEGISVSVPIFYATGDRMRAFKLSFLSGLAEPAGALIGYLVLLPFLTPALIAALLAFVAGIMVYISLDELLPLAHSYGTGHSAILGIVLGMAIMAASLLVLAP